jgi:hypothetical protein
LRLLVSRPALNVTIPGGGGEGREEGEEEEEKHEEKKEYERRKI